MVLEIALQWNLISWINSTPKSMKIGSQRIMIKPQFCTDSQVSGRVPKY